MRNVIIIPAFNPPSHFHILINQIFQVTNIPIIVIDDGSQTPIDISNYKNKIKLIINEINEGKGSALLKAFNYAEIEGFTHAVTLDADFQHDPKFIPKFLSLDENISIVSGKRSFYGRMPFHRSLSNNITSTILSVICKAKILDSQCGYRRYVLKDVLAETYLEKGFQFESEILIKILRQNKKISHIKIPTIYSNEKSAINNFQDTVKFIRLIIRNILNISILT